MSEKGPFRSGFVGLIGRPNSGKSTLLNTVLGERLSLVSSLPQTTRSDLKGIYSAPGLQLIFVDTPGIHEGKHALNRSISRTSLTVLTDGSLDVACYLVDMAREFGEEENFIAGHIQAASSAVLLVFNKADMVENAEERRRAFYARYPDLERHPSVVLAAVEPQSQAKFLGSLVPLIPEGPQYYPEDELTDANLRFFAAEFVREQVIRQTREEVPHATMVEIFVYKELPDRHVIDANIHVETDGQKAIIIGRKGSLIKRIQARASERLSELTGIPAQIRCHVKVSPKWRDNKGFLSSMGMGGR